MLEILAVDVIPCLVVFGCKYNEDCRSHSLRRCKGYKTLLYGGTFSGTAFYARTTTNYNIKQSVDYLNLKYKKKNLSSGSSI